MKRENELKLTSFHFPTRKMNGYSLRSGTFECIFYVKKRAKNRHKLKQNGSKIELFQESLTSPKCTLDEPEKCMKWT